MGGQDGEANGHAVEESLTTTHRLKLSRAPKLNDANRLLVYSEGNQSIRGRVLCLILIASARGWDVERASAVGAEEYDAPFGAQTGALSSC